MTTEAIISIVALAFVLSVIIYLIRKGRKDTGQIKMSRKDAELVFESEWYQLDQFIKGLKNDRINEENEAKIILRLNELNRMKGADDEKLQTLNAEFRRKFSVTLRDIVADHEDY